MFIFIPYFSSTARSPGSYLVVFGLASLISLIVVSILYSEAYSDLNALQTYQCHIQRQFITQRLCTVQDCTKAQQFNIRNFEPPRMYGGSDPTSTNLEMFKQRNEEQVTQLLQQQPSPTTCQSYTSLCYEAEWYVNYNGYYGGYSTIASGMVSTSPEQAAQVLELVSNRSVIPYNCYARASYSTFHWHQWQFPVLIPQDWLIGVIVTSVLTSLFMLMLVVYLGVCIYRRRRSSSSRRASSINDSEKQPLNIENGRKTPSSSASSGATKKKATTTTTRNVTSHATSTTLPRTQQQQIPATTNVMVSQPQQNTQYYNNTATTQIGNNNMDNGAIVYYNNNGGAVNNAQSSGANYQQQPQPQSMYQK
ncbi:hypothetical protein C9374_005189 [Naegleria lovaniensis]|uniref:Uncharacterized protein n=1 Tax=Naegleria lovaniensis TaxID=51637 RepID=A0AA88KIA4_NAELO|nr:uncharacterized protein C9374_005189 [Naegleria lovaniensis]KAG2382609.1 hypothetical protein C9374_005189 [Naegleria lovaniensis]